MKIELACAACGSNNFELGDAETDDCEVTCAECGHSIGTLGILKQRIADEVVQRSKARKARSQRPSPTQ